MADENTQAEIARLSALARQQVDHLDQLQADALLALYQEAVQWIQAEITRSADASGNVPLAALQDLLQQVQAAMERVRRSQIPLLQDNLRDSAALGAGVWVGAAMAGLLAYSLLSADSTADDGLSLTDRLQRLKDGAVQQIAAILRRNIVAAQDAKQAAEAAKTQGESVPPDIKTRANLAQASELIRAVEQGLISGDTPAYAAARRVFRTEANRIHGEAYQAGAGSNPEVVGMRFNLSPNHPRVDICDYYASANLYGLGPGVYPVGEAPWPAHPNTMSYLTAVFADEVKTKDEAGKMAPLDYLRALTVPDQEAILGRQKATALRAGVLAEDDITTPWKDLKDDYERRGYDFA